MILSLELPEPRHLPCSSLVHPNPRFYLTRREGLKNSAGALYIRAAMQFMRLPLKTDPKEALKSTIELTKIICQVPGMIRYGPL